MRKGVDSAALILCTCCILRDGGADPDSGKAACRDVVKQILSKVVEKHFQHGVEDFQGEPGFDWVLREAINAKPRNPVASWRALQESSG